MTHFTPARLGEVASERTRGAVVPSEEHGPFADCKSMRPHTRCVGPYRSESLIDKPHERKSFEVVDPNVVVSRHIQRITVVDDRNAVVVGDRIGEREHTLACCIETSEPRLSGTVDALVVVADPDV